MRYTLGSLLSPADQRTALTRYVHRYTRDHVPAWAKKSNGTVYQVQFASDMDWLSNTTFPVRKDGSLAARGACNSHPTWPDSPDTLPAGVRYRGYGGFVMAGRS